MLPGPRPFSRACWQRSASSSPPGSPGSAGYISATLTVLTAAYLLVMLWRGKAHGGLLMLVLIPWLVYVVAQVATGGRLTV